MHAYRSSVLETTGFTPCQFMFGWKVQLPTDFMIGQQPSPDVTHQEYTEQLRKKFKFAFSYIRDRMGWVQKQQKQLYDCRVIVGKFEVGDLVQLHSPAVSQASLPSFIVFGKALINQPRYYQMLLIVSSQSRIQSHKSSGDNGGSSTRNYRHQATYVGGWGLGLFFKKGISCKFFIKPIL